MSHDQIVRVERSAITERWRQIIKLMMHVGLGFVLKCFARGSYAVEQEFELDKNIDYRCH